MKIPLSRPDITGKEQKAVMEVLKTPHLALGPKITEFENNFIRYVGTKYAVAVSSGTAGLHLLIRAMGIGEGDEVITTPFSFIATANCILFERAKPVFVDIEPNTLNIDLDKIKVKIKTRSSKIKAILAVDVFGLPCDWSALEKISRMHNLRLIEDSAEALGAELEIPNSKPALPAGRSQKPSIRKAGSFGDAGIFAFYPNKQITTGEGGVILTDNKNIAGLCRSMANQGREIVNGNWLEHTMLGYNYRLSDINCALGIAQLERIEEILEKRRKVARTYNALLKGVPGIKVPYQRECFHRSWFVYVIQLAKEYKKKDRDRILIEMKKRGIGCSNYFPVIHLQRFYRDEFGYKEGDFPIAEGVSNRTISLPFYNNLSPEDMEYVVANLKTLL